MSKRRPKAASFSSRVCPPTGEVSVGRCMASVCGMGPKLRGTFGLVTRRPIQISSGLILGVLLGVLIPHGRSYGQAAQAETAGQWSASFGAGFLVPPRPVIRGLIEGHALRSELSWNSKAFGFWAAHRHQPRWGFSVIATDTGAPEHIGRQVAALSHVDLALHGRLHFRLGGGLGWTQKTWGSLTAPGRERVVIGSSINGAAQIGVGLLPAQNSTAWHRNWGISMRLDHQSNASFKQPNLGTNVVSLNVNAVLMRTAVQRIGEVDKAVIDLLPAPITGGYLFLGIGRRQPAPLADQENVMECGYEYRFGGRARIGYVTGGLLAVRPQHVGSSLHAGFQLRFTRIHIDLLHGRYLQRWQPEENQYNRVVLNVYLSKGWWSRLVLHTHGFRAHHPALGIAWTPGHRSPLYPVR